MAVDKRAVAAYLDRDFDDFTWMKKLARAAVERELAAMRVPPVFKTEPWLHQLVCFYIGLCYPRFLFLLDMGTGKTKILADLMTQLLREGKMKRALVGVPRLINIESWREDIERHSDLGFWAVGSDSAEEKRERLLYPPRDADVTVIDYPGLHLALCDRHKKTGKLVVSETAVARAREVYDFVGIDESHKLSNPDSLWYRILNRLCESAGSVYAATGTLFGKDVMAVHSQFQLVDRGETFGEGVGLFKAGLFTKKQNQWARGGVEWKFDSRKSRKLHRMLQHRSLRYEDSEVHDLPKRVARRSVVEMSAEQREHYNRALEGLINSGGKLSALEAPWVRMRQIGSGYLAWKDANGDHVLPFARNPKLDEMERLLDEMGDSKAVVCYDYTETGKLIVERVKSMGLGYEWFYGGTKDHAASRRRFMTDPACKVFVMNSAAGGEGNDGLQKVARYMIFFETPCPPILRRQTEKRIHRPGQEFRVYIWDIVLQRSLDGGILTQIAEGIDVHARVVNGKLPGKKFFLTEAHAF